MHEIYVASCYALLLKLLKDITLSAVTNTARDWETHVNI